MIVTKIESVTKTRSRVYVDGEEAFVLYKGEISRYKIAEGEEIGEASYREIREKVILKRAKLRAMHLLNDMDRTESQLRDKLKTGGYPDDITEKAIQYVKSFGYVDDGAYAARFVERQKDRKSRREISFALYRKGIDKETVDRAVSECYAGEEPVAAIEAILRKKNYNPACATPKEQQKMQRLLARKGFEYGDIRQVIQVSWDDA